MRRYFNIIGHILILVLIVSCNSVKENSLALSDKILCNDPNRALAILDSLEDSGELSHEEQLHLAWNRAKAHYMLNMSLAEEEKLPEAITYYRKDKDKQTDSYLLEASYLCWKGKENEAINAIERGIREISGSTKQVQLLNTELIIFERQRKYLKAIEIIEKTLKYNLSKRDRAMLNFKKGEFLSLMGYSQSELFYDKSIQLAVENGDTAIACEFLRNYADYLSNNGQYRRSNDMYHQIAAMMPSVAEMSAIQMSMTGNYINLRQIDSAQICNDKAIKSENNLETKGFADIARRVAIEQQRYLLDYANGKPVSYVNFVRYCDSITIDIQSKEKTLVSQQEAKAHLQLANKELELGRHRLWWMLSVALILLVGSIVVGYLYHKNRVQRLAEAEDRIETLTRMLTEAQASTIDKSESDDAFFKKILLQQLGIIRMVASAPTTHNQAMLKRISSISEGKIPTNSLLNWSDLYPVIDRLYDNFHLRLSTLFADRLSEKEIQICCLLCAGFSTKEIGVITQQSDATIYVRKTSIRKKIGATEGQDIVACINNIKA